MRSASVLSGLINPFMLFSCRAHIYSRSEPFGTFKFVRALGQWWDLHKPDLLGPAWIVHGIVGCQNCLHQWGGGEGRIRIDRMEFQRSRCEIGGNVMFGKQQFKWRLSWHRYPYHIAMAGRSTRERTEYIETVVMAVVRDQATIPFLWPQWQLLWTTALQECCTNQQSIGVGDAIRCTFQCWKCGEK